MGSNPDKQWGRLRYALYDVDIYHFAYVKTPDVHPKINSLGNGEMIGLGTRSKAFGKISGHLFSPVTTSQRRLVRHERLQACAEPTAQDRHAHSSNGALYRTLDKAHRTPSPDARGENSDKANDEPDEASDDDNIRSRIYLH